MSDWEDIALGICMTVITGLVIGALIAIVFVATNRYEFRDAYVGTDHVYIVHKQDGTKLVLTEVPENEETKDL